MEIVTYVLEGALEHKDSMGTGSVIRPGDVQRMSAGTGVTHSEFNPSKTEPVHFLQIWILPDAAGLPPSYEQKAFGAEERRDRLRLIASRDGRDGSLTIHQDAALYVGAPRRAARAWTTRSPTGRHAWVQVARGARHGERHAARRGRRRRGERGGRARVRGPRAGRGPRLRPRVSCPRRGALVGSRVMSATRHPTLPAWQRQDDGGYAAEINGWALRVTWHPESASPHGAHRGFTWKAERGGARLASDEIHEEIEVAMAEAEAGAEASAG